MCRNHRRMSLAAFLALVFIALFGCAAAEITPALAQTPEAYTVSYRFLTPVPRSANTNLLPAALEGVPAGDAVMPDASDYSAEGYIWSGWHIQDAEEVAAPHSGNADDASSGFIMPSRDVTLAGGWTADVSALHIEPLDSWYTGEPQTLRINGVTDYDEAYIKLGDAPWVTMPRGEAELINATDGALDVAVRVERDGALVWEAATTALLRPRALVFEVETRSFVYDGKPHSVAASPLAPVDENGGLVSGEQIELRLSAQSVQTLCTGGFIPVDAAEVSPFIASPRTSLQNYAITVLKGGIEITPRPVTLTAPGGRFEYDASEHALSASDVTAKGFLSDVAGFSVGFSGDSGARRAPGEQDVWLDIATLELVPSESSPARDGGTLKEQYDITLAPGSLTVTISKRAARVNVYAPDITLVYDGREHTARELGFTTEGLPEGLELRGIEASGGGLQVGKYRLTLDGEPQIIDTSVTPEADVTSAYNVRLFSGQLTIAPAQVDCVVEHWLETDEGYRLEKTTLVSGMSGDGLQASAFAEPFEGYTLWDAEQSGESFDIGCSARLTYRRQHTLSYRINGAVPEGAGQTLPEELHGLFEGEQVAIDPLSREVEGYIWSGWRVMSGGVELPPAGGGIVMPHGDVVVEGGWTPDVSGLAAVGIDGFYTGGERYVAVNGILEGDEVFVLLGGEAVPPEEAAFRDVTDTSVTVQVVRGGQTIWISEARVCIRKRLLVYEISDASYIYNASAQMPELLPVGFEGEGYGFAPGEGGDIALGGAAARTYVTNGAEPVGGECVSVAFSEGTNADNYDVQILSGSIEILPRPVTLVLPALNRAYDASYASVTLADVAFGETGGFLADVAAWSASFMDGSDRRRAPGEQPVWLDLSTLSLTPAEGFEGAELTVQYAVSQYEGEISIYPQAGALAVTLRALPQSLVYDGQTHAIDTGDATAFVAEGLPEGLRVEGAGAYAEGGRAGEYVIDIVGEPRLWDGDIEVTQCFTVNRVSSVLTIEPSPLVITLQDAAYDYSGARRYLNWEARGVAPSDILEPALVGNGQTEVGVYEVTVDAEALRLYTADDAYEDVTYCYRLESVKSGYLSILPVMSPYTVRCALGADDTRDETLWALNDGAPLDIASLPLSHTFEGYVFDRVEPAEAAVSGDGSTVITLYYNRLSTLSYEYEGYVPFDAPPPPPSVGGLVSGTEVPLDVTPRKVEGYRWNGWRAESPDATIADGTLTMPDGDVRLIGSWSPDTDALNIGAIDEHYTGAPYTLRLEGMLEGDAAYITADGGRRPMEGGEALFTDVCDITATVEVERGGAVIWSADASVRIKPRMLEYTVISERRVYDAMPHAPAVANTTPGDRARGYGAADGQAVIVEVDEGAAYTYVTGGAVHIGADKLRVRYENGAKPENYSVSIIPGTFEITRRPVRLISPGGVFPYDATTHALNAEDAVTADGMGFLGDVSGFTVSFARGEDGASLGERRVPGEQETSLDLRTLALTPAPGFEGANVAAQYDVTVASGVLRVERVAGLLPLRLVARAASRVYDGRVGGVAPDGFDAVGLPEGVALGGVRAAADGLWAGVYEVRIEGEPVLLDTSAGVPSDVTACFSVIPEKGVLTIHKRPIRFVAGDIVCKYNGKPHEAKWATDGGGYEGGLAPADAAQVSLSSAYRTEVGVSEVYISGISITNNGVDAMGSYELLGVVSGSIAVKPVETSYTINYYYDGQQDFGASQPSFGQLGDIITSCAGKCRAGMRLARVEGLPLTLSDNPARNTAALYYETVPAPQVEAGRGESGSGLRAE